MNNAKSESNLPDYIIKAADAYCHRFDNSGDLFGNQITVENIRQAFYAGFKSTRQIKSKHVALSVEQERLFEECWIAYGRKGDKGKAKKEWADIPPTSTPFILPHIKIYVSSREAIYKKDFERYLRDRVFATNIVTKNGIVFDASKIEDSGEYHPVADGVFLIWDEKRKRLIFNGDIQNLDDGYTSENRPEGATVAWGMYEWKWCKSGKKWIKQ